MYGTIGRLRIKPGMEGQFRQLLQEQAHTFETGQVEGLQIMFLPVAAHFPADVIFVRKRDITAAALATFWHRTGMNHTARLTEPSLRKQSGSPREQSYRCLHSCLIAQFNNAVGWFSLCNHGNAPSN
jgi:hypothetical protein